MAFSEKAFESILLNDDSLDAKVEKENCWALVRKRFDSDCADMLAEILCAAVLREPRMKSAAELEVNIWKDTLDNVEILSESALRDVACDNALFRLVNLDVSAANDTCCAGVLNAAKSLELAILVVRD